MSRGVALALAGLTLCLIVSQSPVALVFLLTDGVLALVLVATMTLAGTSAVPLLGLEPLPLRWRLLIGAVIGIGGAATLVLVFGVVGLLGRPLWFVILAGLAVAAVAGCGRLGRFDEPPSERRALAGAAPPRGRVSTTRETGHHDRYLWLLLLIAPFLALTLLVSLVPAGFLWAEEGAGYDVLEYHLQLPKEYLQQGRIVYTAHNVYGGFPANAEMLYLLCMVIRDDPYDGAAMAKCVNALLAVLCVLAAYVAGRESSRRAGMVTCIVTAGVGWLTYLSGVAYAENTMLFFAMAAAATLLKASKAASDISFAPAPPQQHGQSLSTSTALRWVALSGLATGFSCGCKYTAVPLIALPLGIMVVLGQWGAARARIRAVAAFALPVLLAFSPWLIKNLVMTGNPVFPLADRVFDACPPGWGPEQARHFDQSHRPGPDESSITDRLERLWVSVPGDRLLRFGPLIFVLAALGLTFKPRGRVDLLLAVVLVVQLLVWTFATHLYSRFAVPLLIPLALLAGRSIDGVVAPLARRGLVALLIVGTMFNALMTGRLYAEHLYHQGTKLPLEGADSYFRRGLGGGHEHLAVINESLPPDSRILMIGDAKAFYFRRPVDYYVVFNRNPFVDAVRERRDARAIVHWLQEQGYTHLLVNWAEVHRLRSSRYGFPDEIQPSLFEELSRHGLIHMQTFATGDPPSPYADLYLVPR